ncbi:NTE family protein [Marininema mesophilum]|uniref:NTE family protein n=1 Tax=Marininema mesophilum TaxID=1048340 RepID=A0A1H2U8X7_9BACL|nr:patatin-like phospholipase family protein [Marininema mesophilum]SDW52626.1 NTE family protein [Marininema mesophilum]
MQADAVLEGGGIKAFGLVGALSVAEEKGYRWKRLAGTSAGSIIASLLAAGYRAEELYRMLTDHPFTSFTPTSWYHRIPLLGPYGGASIRLWMKKGLYPGEPLEEWVGEMLAKKGVYTFADLKEKELSIIASDISRGSLLVLPRDLEEYGHPADELLVATAVRMSCSIPLFFDPVKIQHGPSRKTSYIVDGGVLSNFPVWLFDTEQPRWPTFGFRFLSETAGNARTIGNPISLVSAMFHTMLDAHDNRHIKEQDKIRTIQVPAVGVKLTDFDLDRTKRESLYRAGVEAARDFFRDWSFRQYLANRGCDGSGSVVLRMNNVRSG